MTTDPSADISGYRPSQLQERPPSASANGSARPGAANVSGPSSGESRGPTAVHPLHGDAFASGKAVRVIRPPWLPAQARVNRPTRIADWHGIPGHPEPAYVHARELAQRPSMGGSLAHQPHWHDRESLRSAQAALAPPAEAAEAQRLRRSLAALRQHRPSRRVGRWVAAGTFVAMVVAVVYLVMWRPLSDVYLINALDIPVTVHIDGKRHALVLPHSTVNKPLHVGEYRITVTRADGHVLGDEQVEVPWHHDFVGYNVLGAAALVHTEHDLSSGFDIETQTLLPGTWVTVKRAEFVFEGGLPERVFVIGGGKELIRYTVDVYRQPPHWRTLVRRLILEDRESGARLIERIALADPTNREASEIAVEQLARCFGCDRAREFLDKLKPTMPAEAFERFRADQEDFMERLRMGGAAGESEGGDPHAEPWVDILEDPDEDDDTEIVPDDR